MAFKTYTDDQRKAYNAMGKIGWKIMKELIKELGFDFTRPYIKRYAVMQDGKPKYYYAQISKDKFGNIDWLPVNRYIYDEDNSLIEVQYKKFPVKYFVDEDKIRKHFSSYINADIYENKLSPYYNIFEEYKTEAYAETKTIVMKRSKDSTILAGDIDVHYPDSSETTSEKSETIQKLKRNAEYTFECIRKEFKHILFYERSAVNSGYHFYVVFDSIVKDNDIKNYLEYFNNKYSINNLELKYSTTGLRLPMSATYEAFTSDSQPIQTPQQLFNCIHNQKEIGLVNSYEEFKEKANSIINKVETANTQTIKNQSLFVFEKNCTKEKKSRIRPINISTAFPMTLGNRFRTHFSLANFCIANNLDYATFYSASLSNNRGSKDLTNNANATCKSVWDSANAGFDINKWCNQEIKNIDVHRNSDFGFISNIHLLDDDLRKKANRVSDILIQKLLIHKKEATIKYNSISDSKWFKEQSKAFKIILPELLGYIIYDKENRVRNIRNNARLKEDTRCKFNKGFSFSRNYLSKLKEHYGLKVDVNAVYKFIMDNSGLFKQNKYNNKGWIYIGFSLCKQYELQLRTMIKYDSIRNTILFNLKRVLYSTKFHHKVKKIIKTIQPMDTNMEYISQYIKSLKGYFCNSPPNKPDFVFLS